MAMPWKERSAMDELAKQHGVPIPGDANQRFRHGHSGNYHAKFEDRKAGRTGRQSQAIVGANESPP
jgi:hypothetical protein